MLHPAARRRTWQLAARLGVEAPLRRVRAATLPPAARRDLRDAAAMHQLVSWLLAPDDDAVDVGAHAGAVIERVAEVAPRGRHLALEPLPHLAALLRSRLPQVEVLQCAASDAADRRVFHHVVGDPGLSGLDARATPEDAVERLEVPVVRLDDVAADRTRLRLIKIDVEGAELEVLRGAMGVICEHRPWIVFEHGFGAADHYGTGPDDIHALLTGEAGLRIFGLDGEGPLSLGAMRDSFSRGSRVNFVAHS